VSATVRPLIRTTSKLDQAAPSVRRRPGALRAHLKDDVTSPLTEGRVSETDPQVTRAAETIGTPGGLRPRRCSGRPECESKDTRRLYTTPGSASLVMVIPKITGRDVEEQRPERSSQSLRAACQQDTADLEGRPTWSSRVPAAPTG
jgi:hypothetical protein